MLRSLLDSMLRRSPAQPVAAARAAGRLTVLAYHGIRNPDRFAWQLGYLREHCTPVDLSEAIDLLSGTAEAPRRPVLVTFDDGEPSLVEHGLPILRRHRIPAVAFIVAGLVDTDQPYWWTEVAELVASGATSSRFPGAGGSDLVRTLKTIPDRGRRQVIEDLRNQRNSPKSRQLTSADVEALVEAGVEIGNHSLTHPCLDMCADEEILHEIGKAQEILTALVGRAPRAIAYPNGNHDGRVRAIAARSGLDVGFAFDHRLSDLPVRDLMAVSRVRVASHASEDRFSLVVSGLHPAVHRLRGGV